MTTQEQVQQAVQNFILAGDNNDVAMLEEVLHPQFQNVQDGFFQEEGIFVFSKDDYKQLVGSKRFGGSLRTINFKSVDIAGNIAQVNARLESEFLIFHSTFVVCKTGERWLVIHNIPRIEKK